MTTTQSVPSNVLHFFKVSLSGTLPTTTFQQQFFTSTAQYAPYARKDFGNVVFFNLKGDQIYGWLELIWEGVARFWVKIPGNTSTFFIWFSTTASFNFGVSNYVGEAAYLTTTYGIVDNGSLVFPYYTNFVGGILSSTWGVMNVLFGMNQVPVYPPSSGLYITGITSDQGIINNAVKISPPYIIDMRFNSMMSSTLFMGLCGSAYSRTGGGSTSPAANGTGMYFPSELHKSVGYVYFTLNAFSYFGGFGINMSTYPVQQGGASHQNVYYVMSGYATSTSTFMLVNYGGVPLNNYATSGVYSTHLYSGGTAMSGYLTIGVGSTATFLIQFIRTRVYTTYMPDVSVGKVETSTNKVQVRMTLSDSLKVG